MALSMRTADYNDTWRGLDVGFECVAMSFLFLYVSLCVVHDIFRALKARLENPSRA